MQEKELTAVVVEDDNNGLEVELQHRADLLDRQLETTVADEENRATLYSGLLSSLKGTEERSTWGWTDQSVVPGVNARRKTNPRIRWSRRGSAR